MADAVSTINRLDRPPGNHVSDCPLRDQGGPHAAAQVRHRSNAPHCLTNVCDRAAVEVWDHDGKLYEVNSYYSLPGDAWQYELVGLTGAPGTGPYLSVTIPDATPDDGAFTPRPASNVMVRAGGGDVPWPILRRFIDLVESSGDIVRGSTDGASPITDPGPSHKTPPSLGGA